MYLSYLKAFGPMSCYYPEGMQNTISGYYRSKPINLTKQQMSILASIIVTLGHVMYSISDECDLADLEETARQMKSRNPIAAYSLPTLGNATNEQDSQRNVELTRKFLEDPESHHPVYSLQTRLTSKGNTFID